LPLDLWKLASVQAIPKPRRPLQIRGIAIDLYALRVEKHLLLMRVTMADKVKPERIVFTIVFRTTKSRNVLSRERIFGVLKVTHVELYLYEEAEFYWIIRNPVCNIHPC
jgi:hypothetical protein